MRIGFFFASILSQINETNLEKTMKSSKNNALLGVILFLGFNIAFLEGCNETEESPSDDSEVMAPSPTSSVGSNTVTPAQQATNAVQTQVTGVANSQTRPHAYEQSRPAPGARWPTGPVEHGQEATSPYTGPRIFVPVTPNLPGTW